jgi:HPr kinase/phosphorylase
MAGDSWTRLHASAVLVGAWGVLIRGPSGSGKSALTLALVDGRGGRMIGDDQILVAAVNGRLVARGHPGLAGLVERRGEGIVARPPEPRAVIHLIVDRETAPRLPPVNHNRVLIQGVELSRITIRPDDVDPVTPVIAALRRLSALR